MTWGTAAEFWCDEYLPASVCCAAGQPFPYSPNGLDSVMAGIPARRLILSPLSGVSAFLSVYLNPLCF